MDGSIHTVHITPPMRSDKPLHANGMAMLCSFTHWSSLKDIGTPSVSRPITHQQFHITSSVTWLFLPRKGNHVTCSDSSRDLGTQDWKEQLPPCCWHACL